MYHIIVEAVQPLPSGGSVKIAEIALNQTEDFERASRLKAATIDGLREVIDNDEKDTIIAEFVKLVCSLPGSDKFRIKIFIRHTY